MPEMIELESGFSGGGESWHRSKVEASDSFVCLSQAGYMPRSPPWTAWPSLDISSTASVWRCR